MFVIKESGSQVTKMVALFPIGRYLESKRGQAQALASMIKKSTRRQTNKVLHELLDRYSIQIDIYVSPLYLTAELHCHVNFIEKAVPIFFEILFNAHFTQNSWSLVKRQTIDSILQQQNQTDFWADKLLSEYIFGQKHPYGYYSEPSDYENIKLSDIVSFYENYLKNIKPEIFVAGDKTQIVKNIAKQVLQQYSLKKFKLYSTAIEPSLMPPQRLDKKLDDSSQASVRLGRILKRESLDQFLELELWNTFLGGHYMSELMKELRIKLGLTYGVYTQLIHFPSFSFFQIAYETDAISVDTSIKAINRLFNRLKAREHMKFSEAKKQYYSQCSKNMERSLHETMYRVRMHKLGYDYSEYKLWLENYKEENRIQTSQYKMEILNFGDYSKAIVY